MEREFQIILWGATGFTGRLVARYMCERYGVDGAVRWAIAGRNQSKLRALQQELVALDPAAASLSLLTGDSHDRASLDRIASRTAVILTTVGPYATYGTELVAACVSQQTDYVDLTGEVPFIREMIDTHHEEAEAKEFELFIVVDSTRFRPI